MKVENSGSAEGKPRRTFAFSGGFFSQKRVRRILALAGHAPRIGLPDAGDEVAVWGNSPTAWRGIALARKRGARLIRVEDAFLRSVLPGRAREKVARRGPIGLIIDPVGVHFDASQPSLIEGLVFDPRALARPEHARAMITRLIESDLSKYNAHLPDAAAPAPGYVLIVDQTAGDASLRGAGRAEFQAMLQAARDENPGARLVLRLHPETTSGLRPGHFTAADLRPEDRICDTPVSPWRLLAGADRVYAMSSQLGYEAMLAGHRPRIFGTPFYAGWGLSDDQTPLPHRRPATIEQLFAVSHLLAPTWYDPCFDELTDFETALNQIEAEARAWREDRDGPVAYGIRLWKRKRFAQFFGSGPGVQFTKTPGPNVTHAWANRIADVPQARRVEDGFLRSRGLGAALVPPLSLVSDDMGIYYDPSRPSRFEALMEEPLPSHAVGRARTLIAALRNARISKYNLSGCLPELPDGHLILVPGQVEDDASIRLGAGAERTNADLLRRVRWENPGAVIVYKPHPDVEAGLRPGALSGDTLRRLTDVVAAGADAIGLLDQVDEVWTMTSTLGFEALLRGLPVTTLGAPFYAGWGLTRDLGPVPGRRKARPGLDGLVHAALITYPRYFDPVSGLPCAVETAVRRLADPAFAPKSGPFMRVLSKAQGALSSYAWVWRR